MGTTAFGFIVASRDLHSEFRSSFLHGKVFRKTLSHIPSQIQLFVSYFCCVKESSAQNLVHRYKHFTTDLQPLPSFHFFLSLSRSHYIAQVGIELAIFLPQFPKY